MPGPVGGALPEREEEIRLDNEPRQNFVNKIKFLVSKK
jgi:hypothetical protein